MNGKPFQKVGVIGGGAWGTALAQLCASNGVETLIWAREPDVVASINTQHVNVRFLPEAPLHKDLRATGELGDLDAAEAFLFVSPAQYARDMFHLMRREIGVDKKIALCSKGIERETGRLMTEVLAEVWPEASPAVLSGPSFAKDVAKGLPTAVTLAAADAALAERWAMTVGAPHFRPYASTDLIGAELGGAVKNVLAIAAGAVTGRGLGESARAALIARGFAEFQRLGLARGAAPETMAGLSGLGDLILTASSPQSRNMSLGLALGRGEKLEDILASRESVSEGVATATAVVRLAEKAGVDMPICNAVAELVTGARSLDAIIADLLARPLKTEN